jgi:hypothetical protein
MRMMAARATSLDLEQRRELVANAVERLRRIGVHTAAMLMVMIAAPFFSMRFGSADSGSGLARRTTRKAYDLLDKGFGRGYNGDSARQRQSGQRSSAPSEPSSAAGQCHLHAATQLFPDTSAVRSISRM